LILWTQKAFLEKNHDEQYLFGIYYGILLVMALYNLFLFFSLWDKSYLFYSLYIIGYGFFHMAQNGFAHEYILPTLSNFTGLFYSEFTYIMIFFGLLFCRIFLNTRDKTPIFDKIIVVFLGICILLIIIIFMQPKPLKKQL